MMIATTMNGKFAIEPARDEDWDWILQLHVENAWESLSPPRQAEVSRETVSTRVASQVAEFRAEHGASNQAFVAWDSGGNRAGFVWVGQVRSGFTGKTQAHLLDITVVEACRGQGLGQLLMAEAESWARQKGYNSVSLHVAAHNAAAVGFYTKLGYKTETMKMCKCLGKQ